MKRIFTILTLTIFCLCVFAESVTPDKLLKATINGIEWTYVVLDETKKTCKIGGLNTEGPVQAIAPSVTGVVNVPDVIDGYTVVEIYEEAFYNTNATSIIVPNTVTTIDEDAFKSPYLVTVELPASIVSVDKDAFEKCVALTDVTIHATTPPNVRKRLFPLGDSSETPSKAKLHVPEGCKAAYAAATGWADFSLCGGRMLLLP